MTLFGSKKWNYGAILTKIVFLGVINVYFPKMVIFEISEKKNA